ncbi:MAG TPA: hypothetical protein VFT12_09745 [Thermoanaerobaculia bacterium]|nr:hypothetical protein [Thermoanaerobaculia bacterium]
MLAMVLASVLGCGELCSADAVTLYASMLEEGGYGRLAFERAGFLIREKSGTITMAPWNSFRYRHASYQGSIPAGTIAIVHTHPLSSRRPSAGDRETSRVTGLPVVVVTPDTVTAAMPDGHEVTLIGKRAWWRD